MAISGDGKGPSLKGPYYTVPGQFRLADYVEAASSPDLDTDPEPFKREEVTAKRCSICGRGYELYSSAELRQWLTLNMPADQADAILAAFKAWADRH